MFDRLLMIVEILLLIWVVVQGERVCFYEKEVWRMNADRFEERKQWRLEKKEQTRKKTAQKISDSNPSMESLSPDKMNSDTNKKIDVKSVA